MSGKQDPLLDAAAGGHHGEGLPGHPRDGEAGGSECWDTRVMGPATMLCVTRSRQNKKGQRVEGRLRLGSLRRKCPPHRLCPVLKGERPGTQGTTVDVPVRKAPPRPDEAFPRPLALKNKQVTLVSSEGGGGHAWLTGNQGAEKSGTTRAPHWPRAGRAPRGTTTTIPQTGGGCRGSAGQAVGSPSGQEDALGQVQGPRAAAPARPPTRLAGLAGDRTRLSRKEAARSAWRGRH